MGPFKSPSHIPLPRASPARRQNSQHEQEAVLSGSWTRRGWEFATRLKACFSDFSFKRATFEKEEPTQSWKIKVLGPWEIQKLREGKYERLLGCNLAMKSMMTTACRLFSNISEYPRMQFLRFELMDVDKRLGEQWAAEGRWPCFVFSWNPSHKS